MSIDLYVEQLIEDLQEAAQKVSVRNKPDTIPESSDASFAEHIKDVENYLYGQSEPLSAIVDISMVKLPPADKLSELQQARIYKEMETLLEAFNFYPDFPETVPLQIRYKVMRDKWEMECVYMHSGQTHLEFCNYEPEGCPFPAEHCGCRDLV